MCGWEDAPVTSGPHTMVLFDDVWTRPGIHGWDVVGAETRFASRRAFEEPFPGCTQAFWFTLGLIALPLMRRVLVPRAKHHVREARMWAKRGARRH